MAAWTACALALLTIVLAAAVNALPEQPTTFAPRTEEANSHYVAEITPFDSPPDIAGELVEEYLLGAGVSVDERVDTCRFSPVSGEVVDEGFAALVVEVDAAVDVGKHSIELVRDGDAAATSAITVFVAPGPRTLARKLERG